MEHHKIMNDDPSKQTIQNELSVYMIFLHIDL